MANGNIFRVKIVNARVYERENRERREEEKAPLRRIFLWKDFRGAESEMGLPNAIMRLNSKIDQM
jgi:hypothetical protein